jgi:altronate hydrolase
MAQPHQVLRLHPDDNIAIARARIAAGTPLDDTDTMAAEEIPAAHKVALTAIARGEHVRRYGQIIGFATADIAPGQHVHVQNLAMGRGPSR